MCAYVCTCVYACGVYVQYMLTGIYMCSQLHMQLQRPEDDAGPCSIIFCLILKARPLSELGSRSVNAHDPLVSISQSTGVLSTISHTKFFESARIQVQFLVLVQQVLLPTEPPLQSLVLFVFEAHT